MVEGLSNVWCICKRLTDKQKIKMPIWLWAAAPPVAHRPTSPAWRTETRPQRVATVRIRPGGGVGPAVAFAPCGPRAFAFRSWTGLRHRGGAVERGDSRRAVGPAPDFFCFVDEGSSSRIVVRPSERSRISDGRGARAGRRTVGPRHAHEV